VDVAAVWLRTAVTVCHKEEDHNSGLHLSIEDQEGVAQDVAWLSAFASSLGERPTHLLSAILGST
jgi:hypothetical protein